MRNQVDMCDFVLMDPSLCSGCTHVKVLNVSKELL